MIPLLTAQASGWLLVITAPVYVAGVVWRRLN
ncbi:MAG: hypothetical protein K0R70_2447 [Steroidobacteraceae bacterium]|jgi:hypothetical protein|nr:hypothetical protein [Steroidobacteraceae bacterium]